MKSAFRRDMKSTEQQEKDLLTAVLFFERSSFGNYVLKNQTCVLTLSDALGICAHVQEPEAMLIEAYSKEELESNKSEMIRKMQNPEWICQTFN